MSISRRRFLGGSCAVAATAFLRPRWMAAGSFDSPRAAASGNILVVIQMEGGNDGLNTVVPIADPAYARLRPRIALAPSQTLRVDAATGLHPSLQSMYRLLQSGRLAVVEGVGYPAPDLSHFRSTDVWESGVAERAEATGWLGRALDELYASDPTSLHSLALGYQIPPAFQGQSVATPVMYDPDSFDFMTDGFYADTDPLQRSAMRTILSSSSSRRRAVVPGSRAGKATSQEAVALTGRVALTDAAAIRSAARSYVPAVTYPTSDLAYGLRLVASVIAGNIGPRVFWVTQEGYDTHDSQRAQQDQLLLDLDQAVGAFQDDLAAHAADQRVVTMTWSEFGRRADDNASGGTDHGTAGPVFVIGSKVRGGLFGQRPSLDDLDADGNLRYSTDFRQVYSSLLANWVGADPAQVLGGSFSPVPFL